MKLTHRIASHSVSSTTDFLAVSYYRGVMVLIFITHMGEYFISISLLCVTLMYI